MLPTDGRGTPVLRRGLGEVHRSAELLEPPQLRVLVAHRQSRLRRVGVFEELTAELGIRYFAGDAMGLQLGEKSFRCPGGEHAPDQRFEFDSVPVPPHGASEPRIDRPFFVAQGAGEAMPLILRHRGHADPTVRRLV